MTISTPHVWSTTHRRIMPQLVLCCCLLTAQPMVAAEFIPVGPTSLNADAAIGDLSADGSTIIGLERNSALHQDNIYRWTRETGKNSIENPANLSYYYEDRYLSADGTVVVADRISRSIGGGPDARGGVWTKETGWQLPGPAAATYPGSGFLAVSADGNTAVGTAVVWSGQVLRWTKSGGLEELGVLPGQTRAIARDVSSDGTVIVGTSDILNNTICPCAGQVFRWTTATGMISVADLPAGYDTWSKAPNVSEDGSTLVVGAHRADLPVNSKYDVYRWRSETGLVAIIHDVPQFEGSGGSTLDISDDGTTVVAGGYSGLQRWTEQSGLQTLPHLPGGFTRSIPLSASADGSLILGVSSKGATFDVNQFGLWTADGIVKSLQQVLQEQGLGASIQGWDFTPRTDHYFLSADGRVLAGAGINPAGRTEVFVVYLDPLVIPEPTSAALGLLALACLLSARTLSNRRAFVPINIGPQR